MLGLLETRNVVFTPCFSTFTTASTVYVFPVVLSVPSGDVNVAVAVLFSVFTSATVVHELTSVLPSYTFTVRASSPVGSRSKLSPFIVAVICFPLLYSTWSRLKVMLLMANVAFVTVCVSTATPAFSTSSNALTDTFTVTSGSMFSSSYFCTPFATSTVTESCSPSLYVTLAFAKSLSEGSFQLMVTFLFA